MTKDIMEFILTLGFVVLLDLIQGLIECYLDPTVHTGEGD